MSSFRRTFFALLACFTLLFGFGSFTAAAACPSTLPSLTRSSNTNDDCCDQKAAEDCILISCSLICHAVPSTSSASLQLKPNEASYWSNVTVLLPVRSGPEPPPPRMP